MVGWLALIISIMALIQTSILNRDKWLATIDAYKSWRTEVRNKKKALETIKKITAEETNTTKRRLQLAATTFYLPLFLISVMSSAVLSFRGQQPHFYNTILLSTSVYFAISMIVFMTFLYIYKRLEWVSILALFVAILMFSALWGITVIVAEAAGLRMIWSGIVAGGFLTLWLWVSERKNNSQLRKQNT